MIIPHRLACGLLACTSLLLLGGCPPKGNGSGGPPVPRPDLSASVTGEPASAFPGTPIDLVAQVCNQGDDTAPSSELRFALPDASGSDPLGGSQDHFVPSLYPGECFSQPLTGFVPVDGVYTPFVMADPRFEIQEQDEANNVGMGAAIGVGYAPDWIVRIASAPDSSLPWQPFPVTVEVCNQGTQSGPAPWVGVYASLDEVIEHDPAPGGDDWIGGAPAPILGAGQCGSIEVDAVAPASGGPGAYYLGAIVDPDAYEPELIEDNNAHTGPRIGLGSGPNLVVETILHPPSALPSSPLSVELRACNTGTTPAGPSQALLGLSPDAGWTPPAEDPETLDREIASLPLPPLAEGECTSVSTQAPAFIGGDEGAYHLIGIADPWDDVAELIEDDNTLAAGPIGIGALPDWIVTAITAPASVMPGAAFDATVRICNQGTTPGSNAGVLLVFSADGNLPPDPFPAGAGFLSAGPLDPGTCADAQAQLLAFPPDGDGAYTLLAIADESDADIELIESNNVFAGPVMGIGNGPDWVVESLDLPASLEPGLSYPLGARVCNIGTQPGPSTDVTFYLSEDAVIEGILGAPPPQDAFLFALPVAPLEPGACVDVTDSGPSVPPLPSGPYHAGAIVDESDFGPELVETNNHFVGPLVGVGSDPDLVVAAVSGPPSAQLGAAIDVDFEVCNQGTQPSTPTDLAIWLLPDSGAVPGGPAGGPPPLAWAPVPPLVPGACHPGTTNGPATPAHGEGASVLAARVDEADFVSELIEDNNTAVGGPIGIGSAPDLRVQTLTGPPSAAPGQPISLDVEICNDGTTASPTAWVDVLLSSDAIIESPFGNPASPDLPVGSVSVPPLAAGTCHVEVAPVWLFPTEGDGLYHLGAIVDEPDSVVELIETNNTLLGDAIGVGIAPDLRITSVLAPSPVQLGIAFSLDVEVCNEGTAGSPAHDVALLLSSDSALAYPPPPSPPAGTWELLTHLFVPPLGEGLCTSLQEMATSFLPPGSYSVVALADSGEAVDELREDNNRHAATSVQVDP